VILWVCLTLLLLGGISAVAIGNTAAVMGLTGDMIAGIAASLALLIFLGSSILGDYRGHLTTAARDMIIWGGLALLLVIGYTFRDEASYIVNRVAGELLPPGRPITVSTGTRGLHAVRIRQRSDRHFIARSRINGTNIILLVDTGASTVVLKPADARSVGIDPSRLSYTIPVNTANGAAFTASVRLNEVSIGPIVIRDIEALVAKPGTLKESLLGMNFLRRLRSYEFAGEFLTLRGP